MVTKDKFYEALHKALKVYEATPDMYITAEGLEHLSACADKVYAFLDKKQQVTFDEYLECFANALNEIEGDGDIEKWESMGKRMIWLVNIIGIILREDENNGIQ